jgi:hypothetical protein
MMALLSGLPEYLLERMRPHPAPKIGDEGLRGASKMMDDNLSVFGKIVETVRRSSIVRTKVSTARPSASRVRAAPSLADNARRKRLLPIEAPDFSQRARWGTPLLPLEFFRHYWQYAAGRFSEFAACAVPPRWASACGAGRAAQCQLKFAGRRAPFGVSPFVAACVGPLAGSAIARPPRPHTARPNRQAI